jgi:hypothetical protein
MNENEAAMEVYGQGAADDSSDDSSDDELRQMVGDLERANQPPAAAPLYNNGMDTDEEKKASPSSASASSCLGLSSPMASSTSPYRAPGTHLTTTKAAACASSLWTSKGFKAGSQAKPACLRATSYTEKSWWIKYDDLMLHRSAIHVRCVCFARCPK